MKHPKKAKTWVIAVCVECPHCKAAQTNSADGSMMWETDHFPQDHATSWAIKCNDCGQTYRLKRPKCL